MRTSVVEIQGFALRVIRERAGRTQADLAEAVGIDRSHLAKVETGHTRRISTVLYSALLRELVIDDYRALLADPPGRDQPPEDQPAGRPTAAPVVA